MRDGVMLTLEGRFLERLLERALERGAVFKRIERVNERKLRLLMPESSARLVQALAREYGLTASEISRTGWPAVRRALRARWTLPVSLLAAAVLVVFLSGRIWRVDIKPLGEALPAEAQQRFSQTLSSLGACVGQVRSSLDCGAVSAELMSRFEELSYVSVKVRGVCLTAEYRLRREEPPVYEADEVCHLYALRDSVVVSVTPLAGKACVEPGDTVRAGQILIRGEERVSAEETRPVRAAGMVTGRVWTSCTESAPLQSNVTQRTGRRRVASALRLLGWSFDLTQARPFEQQEEIIERLPVGGLYLPLMIERHVFYETAQKSIEEDLADLEARLSQRALDRAREQMPGEADERAVWTQTILTEGVMSVEAVVEAEMNIAVGAETLLRGGA